VLCGFPWRAYDVMVSLLIIHTTPTVSLC